MAQLCIPLEDNKKDTGLIEKKQQKKKNAASPPGEEVS